jgi:hypothetical protein
MEEDHHHHLSYSSDCSQFSAFMRLVELSRTLQGNLSITIISNSTGSLLDYLELYRVTFLIFAI